MWLDLWNLADISMLKRLIRARLSQTQQKTEITWSAINCYSTEIFRFHRVLEIVHDLFKHLRHHPSPVEEHHVEDEQGLQLGHDQPSCVRALNTKVFSEFVQK